MRFGILNHEEEVELARQEASEFEGLRVGVIRKLPPETRETEALAIWVLESLDIVNGVGPEHPAVTILLELIKKRKAGEGITGSELTNLTKIGKTQTYYWLKRMKEAGLVNQGKKKLIEHGAVRVMSGFYLSGPNLSYTIANIKKQVEESFDSIIGVSENLQDALKTLEMSSEAVTESEVELPTEELPAAMEPEGVPPVEEVVEEESAKSKVIPQPDSIQPVQPSENHELSE